MTTSPMISALIATAADAPVGAVHGGLARNKAAREVGDMSLQDNRDKKQ